MPKQVISNLSKGELGPELYGRIDTPQYQAGVRRARNFIIQKYGGMAFRPGFRFVGEADDVETPNRYVPFQNSIEYAYVLAMMGVSFRPLALGGMMLEEDDPASPLGLEILSISSAAQAVLEVSFHACSVGDRFYLDGISGMTELNGRFGTVLAIVDASHLRTDIDTRGLTAFTSSTGIDRSGAPPPPAPAPPAPPPPPAPSPPPPIGSGGGSGGGIGGYVGETP